MWPWTRREPAQDDLRTRLLALESEHRRIRAEWADILDRLLRMDERQRKRAERAETSDPAPQTPHDVKAALRARWLASSLDHHARNGRA